MIQERVIAAVKATAGKLDDYGQRSALGERGIAYSEGEARAFAANASKDIYAREVIKFLLRRIDRLVAETAQKDKP